MRLLAIPALLVSLLGTGCERVVLGFLNRGVAAPEATALYAPEQQLSLDIYRPAMEPGTTVPVAVFFYGGAWQRGSRTQYRFVGQRLAQHGILAIVADYRTWPQAGFPAFMDDAAMAVKWTRDNVKRWGGDPQRIFLAGHSAGAQIAALLATDDRYLARHDLEPRLLAGAVGLSGPYDFAINGKLREVFGDPAQWPAAQPVNFVDGDEPPFLLVHGQRDRVVESVDSVQFADRLEANGIDVTLKLLPEGSHSAPLLAFYDPARAPVVLPAVLDFVVGEGSSPEG
jgi:acetyl esterase/lipase